MKRYDEAFRDRALQILAEGVPVKTAARELGVSPSVIRKWRDKDKAPEEKEASQVLSESERVELKRLRKENQELREEREILKKATAYFAKIAK